MEHSKDFHALSFHAVDNPVGALDQLAYQGEAEVGAHAPRQLADFFRDHLLDIRGKSEADLTATMQARAAE